LIKVIVFMAHLHWTGPIRPGAAGAGSSGLQIEICVEIASRSATMDEGRWAEAGSQLERPVLPAQIPKPNATDETRVLEHDDGA
jgi:hypothetical protein